MLKLCANLSMLYTETEFLNRFQQAASDGFKGVEYLFPYALPAAEIQQRLQDHQLQQVLFNLHRTHFCAIFIYDFYEHLVQMPLPI